MNNTLINSYCPKSTVEIIQEAKQKNLKMSGKENHSCCFFFLSINTDMSFTTDNISSLVVGLHNYL